MSASTVKPRANGQIIDSGWFNRIKDALTGDLVPRNASGVATDLGGSIGNASYRYLKSFIKVGHFRLGDIKLHHTYNGVLPIGQGWMLCDGRQVTQANYDTEHGSGSWATYIGSSPMLNLYLPNMTGRVPVGATATSQNGTASITTVGITGNSIDLNHNHKYLHALGAGLNDQSFNVNGNMVTIGNSGIAKNSGKFALHIFSGYSNNHRYSDKQLTTVDITPPSTRFQFYMRII